MSFHLDRLSARVWKIVEADRFGQYPFVYVVMGADKCAVIDTGCGGGDLRAFIDAHVNTARLPYLVINTHVHFDVRGPLGSRARGVGWGGGGPRSCGSCARGIVRGLRRGGCAAARGRQLHVLRIQQSR